MSTTQAAPSATSTAVDLAGAIQNLHTIAIEALTRLLRTEQDPCELRRLIALALRTRDLLTQPPAPSVRAPAPRKATTQAAAEPDQPAAHQPATPAHSVPPPPHADRPEPANNRNPHRSPPPLADRSSPQPVSTPGTRPPPSQTSQPCHDSVL